MGAPQVVRRGLPWPIIGFVGLLIAKMGFGVQIAWLWVTAPLWIPLAFVLGCFAIVVAVWLLYLIAVGLVAFVDWLVKTGQRNKQRARMA